MRGGERTVLDTDATGSRQNTADGYLYADNFEYEGKTVPVLDGKGGFTGETENYIASCGGDKGAMAHYTHTMNGAFEVYKSGTGNHVLRQQSDATSVGVGDAWNKGDPVTLIGDFRWTNYTASVDVLSERSAENQYAQIGIRQTGSNHRITNCCGYSLKVSEKGEWQLYRSNDNRTIAKTVEVAAGNLDTEEKLSEAGKPGNWFQLKLRSEGNVIKAFINNVLVATYEDENPITSGRVALGCSSSYTRFDNLAVTKIKGFAPYYTEYLDNMETYDLSEQKNTKLEYNDKWAITCADQGMFVYQRSMSYSKEAGAALTYTFQGTGLEILGKNQAVSNKGKDNEISNKVNVTVDGETLNTNDTIWDADNMCTAYRVDGLPFGEHTVTIEVSQGSLAIDAVAVLGEAYQGEEVHLPPKTGTENNLPEEELPKDLNKDVIPTLNPPASPGQQATPLKKGTICKSGNAFYVVTNVSNKTLAYQKPAKSSVKNAVIPATVKIKMENKSVTFKVTAISAKAFAKCVHTALKTLLLLVTE